MTQRSCRHRPSTMMEALTRCRSNWRLSASTWQSVSGEHSGETTPKIASPGEFLTASALGRGAHRKIVSVVTLTAQKAAAIRSSGITASALLSASRVRRRSSVRLLSLAAAVGACGRTRTRTGRETRCPGRTVQRRDPDRRSNRHRQAPDARGQRERMQRLEWHRAKRAARTAQSISDQRASDSLAVAPG
jgi:hypothetical protein